MNDESRNKDKWHYNILRFCASRYVILISVLWMWTMAYAQSAQQVQKAIDTFTQRPGVPESGAVLIADLNSGELLGQWNVDRPLVPASIMKCVTIASLLEEADENGAWVTPVYIDGPASREGVLKGNLIIEGRGDPSLDSPKGPESPSFVKEIGDALEKRGVKEIQGRIIIDGRYFQGTSTPDSWLSGDLSAYYGTGSHALNYASNSSGQKSVSNPGAVFETALKRELASKGITLTGESLASGKREKLLEHKSAPLKEIMRGCMMRSDNLFAESMLRRIGRELGGDGSTPDAAERETKKLKSAGIRMDGVHIVDGSGLSRSNRVTANFMADIMARMAPNVEYAGFLPLAGQEGTLKKFLGGTDLEAYLALKTGSMKGIQCYCGYKLDDDFAPTHIVVVILNDFKGDRGALKGKVEKMLLEIFSSENENADE